MAFQCYVPKNFKPASLRMIDIMNAIIEDYQAQGFKLTVRQLYYQMVAKDIIPNKIQEYKKLANLINDGKLAGLIDWDAIEDRTREFVRKQRWQNGAEILQAAVSSYHKDMWDTQSYRVFVVVEKEALVGVLEPTCRKFDVPILAARGYPSGTVLREFVESDVIPTYDADQIPIFLHLGDHDPSGMDMTRDLTDRITLFSGRDDDVELTRIALNMDQIREQRPPKNPAKSEDARFKAYAKQFGNSSWELDALSPRYLADLLTRNIQEFIHQPSWDIIAKDVRETKQRIIDLSEGFK